jgi:uncharacterized membrane protein
MWALLGLLAGALAGHALWHEWGAVFGGLAGFMLGATLAGNRQRAAFRKPDPVAAVLPAGAAPPPADAALTRRIGELEQRIATLERALGQPALGEAQRSIADDVAEAARAEASPFTAAASAAAAHAAAPSSAPAALLLPPAGATLAPSPAAEVPPPFAPEAPRIAAPGAALPEPAPPDSVAPRATPSANPLWAWFTGGNALTRIGVVVLFFGVAFLLRYFAEHFTVPIELRLAGVAAAGGALIAIGLRLTSARPAYGLSLQGAGAGILYLTIYAALRLYAVLGDEIAIALLIGVAGLTIWLSLRADSQPLAGLAIAGGFLAPLLTATRGEPLPLFAYFAVLNGAIFALAWRRAWRALNVLGFVCTFVLGLFWGHRYYASEHFATVEPFLVLFFAFYVAIALLEARRGALDVKRPVDGLLVFGVPLAGFALQVAIVQDFHHGAAWSALALALVYAGLFVALRKRTEPGLALTAKAFLALAVIFATLAIPLAFDDRWTAALWAVEAAGVYWIGTRQDSLLARGFALLVQLGAGVAFVGAGTAPPGDPAFANAHFIGAMLIALSGLVSASIADHAGSVLSQRERPLTPLVFGWGVLWWLGAGGMEVARLLSRADEAHGALTWVVASVAVALALRRPLKWPRLAAVGVALLPAMGYVALRDFEIARTTLTAYGWLVWPVAWITHGFALRAADRPPLADTPAASGPPGAAGVLRIAHAFSAFALTAQFAWEASEWIGRITPAHTAWVACAAALPAIACLWLVTGCRDLPRWPFAIHGDAYAIGAGMPVAGLLALWFVAVNALSPGDVSPLPYLPLANPLDLTLLAALAALLGWARRFAGMPSQRLYGWLGVGLFVALNGIVLRTAHHWGDIPWRLPALLASKPLQASLTLTWTATAVVVMFAATRRRLRPLWMVGAALLAAVVAKLFLIDLGALSGLPRVVAFLGVGILLLAIGYLSPLPPAGDEDT